MSVRNRSCPAVSQMESLNLRPLLEWSSILSLKSTPMVLETSSLERYVSSVKRRRTDDLPTDDEPIMSTLMVTGGPEVLADVEGGSAGADMANGWVGCGLDCGRC